MSQYIVELQEFIQKMYGVQAMHIDSVRTTHILQDHTVWDGMIEVFELHGHPKAPIVYAWAQNANQPGKPKKYFAILHLNSVDSQKRLLKRHLFKSAGLARPPKSGLPKLSSSLPRTAFTSLDQILFDESC